MSETPGIVEEDVSAAEVIACVICGNVMDGKLIPNEQNSKYLSSILGFTCENCGAYYCKDIHSKQLKANWLGMAHKSTCVRCGQLIGFGKTIIKAEDYKGEPEHAEEEAERKAQAAGYTLTTDKVPEKCPSCGGSNISAFAKPIKSAGGRLFDIIMGVVCLGAVAVMNLTGQISEMNETIALLIQAGGLLFGLGFLWTGLTLRPVPFLGRYIIAPDFETRATCKDCQHSWIVGKKEAPAN